MNLYTTTLPDWALCCFRPQFSPDVAEETSDPQRPEWAGTVERVSVIEEDAERWDGLA